MKNKSLDIGIKGLSPIELRILLALIAKIKLSKREKNRLKKALMAAKVELEQEQLLYQHFKDSNVLSNLYTPVTWPENQEYMDKRWFRKEAILDVDSKVDDSTYLIPIKRLH